MNKASGKPATTKAQNSSTPTITQSKSTRSVGEQMAPRNFAGAQTNDARSSRSPTQRSKGSAAQKQPEGTRSIQGRALNKSENSQSAKALTTQSIPQKRIKEFDVANDPDLLRRSEQIFNQQSAAQKMKIFNEMELYIKQQ